MANGQIPTERDPHFRCTSSDVEREGRTHHCKVEVAHEPIKHTCICGRTWEDKEVKA